MMQLKRTRITAKHLDAGTRPGQGFCVGGRIPVWVLSATIMLILSGSGVLFAQQGAPVDQGQFAESLGKTGASWYDKTNDRAVFPGTLPDRPAASADRSSIPTTAMKTGGTPNRFNFNFDWLGPWTTWITLSILILLLAILVIWIVSRQKAGADSGRLISAERDDRNRVEHLPFEMDRTIRDFHAAALAAAREKNYRQAIIFLYSHALMMLDQKGIVQLRKGKTNRQYLTEVLRQCPGGSGFRRMIHDFEAVFFGNHPALEQDFERVLADANGVENLTLPAGSGGI